MASEDNNNSDSNSNNLNLSKYGDGLKNMNTSFSVGLDAEGPRRSSASARAVAAAVAGGSTAIPNVMDDCLDFLNGPKQDNAPSPRQSLIDKLKGSSLADKLKANVEQTKVALAPKYASKAAAEGSEQQEESKNLDESGSENAGSNSSEGKRESKSRGRSPPEAHGRPGPKGRGKKVFTDLLADDGEESEDDSDMDVSNKMKAFVSGGLADNRGGAQPNRSNPRARGMQRARSERSLSPTRKTSKSPRRTNSSGDAELPKPTRLGSRSQTTGSLSPTRRGVARSKSGDLSRPELSRSKSGENPARSPRFPINRTRSSPKTLAAMNRSLQRTSSGPDSEALATGEGSKPGRVKGLSESDHPSRRANPGTNQDSMEARRGGVARSPSRRGLLSKSQSLRARRKPESDLQRSLSNPRSQNKKDNDSARDRSLTRAGSRRNLSSSRSVREMNTSDSLLDSTAKTSTVKRTLSGGISDADDVPRARASEPTRTLTPGDLEAHTDHASRRRGQRGVSTTGDKDPTTGQNLDGLDGRPRRVRRVKSDNNVDGNNDEDAARPRRPQRGVARGLSDKALGRRRNPSCDKGEGEIEKHSKRGEPRRARRSEEEGKNKSCGRKHSGRNRSPDEEEGGESARSRAADGRRPRPRRRRGDNGKLSDPDLSPEEVEGEERAPSHADARRPRPRRRRGDEKVSDPDLSPEDGEGPGDGRRRKPTRRRRASDDDDKSDPDLSPDESNSRKARNQNDEGGEERSRGRRVRKGEAQARGASPSRGQNQRQKKKTGARHQNDIARNQYANMIKYAQELEEEEEKEAEEAQAKEEEGEMEEIEADEEESGKKKVGLFKSAFSSVAKTATMGASLGVKAVSTTTKLGVNVASNTVSKATEGVKVASKTTANLALSTGKVVTDSLGVSAHTGKDPKYDEDLIARYKRDLQPVASINVLAGGVLGGSSSVLLQDYDSFGEEEDDDANDTKKHQNVL